MNDCPWTWHGLVCIRHRAHPGPHHIRGEQPQFDAILTEAAAAERKRLRAEHRTWNGHPARGFSCGVCDVLLSPDPRAAKEAERE